MKTWHSSIWFAQTHTTGSKQLVYEQGAVEYHLQIFWVATPTAGLRSHTVAGPDGRFSASGYTYILILMMAG